MEQHPQDSATIAPAYAGMSTPQHYTNASPPNQISREKPRVWPVFLAFVTVVIVGTIATSIYLAVAVIVDGGLSGNLQPGNLQPKLQRVLENPNIMIPSFAVMSSTILIIASICSALSPERVWDRLSLRATRFGARGYAASILVVYGISMAASQLAVPFTHTNSQTLKRLDSRLRSADDFMFALAIVLIAGLAPVAEEVFFRGYVQTRLRRRWGPAWAIGITALLFGALHMDPVQTPVAIATGAALGYAAERNGSIRPAIMCHIINNMVAVMITKLPVSEHNKSTSWPVFAVGVVASVTGVMWLRHLGKKSA